MLKGKIAVVTGGGVNIGRGISLALAGAGAFVYIVYNSSRRGAEETAAGILASGGEAEAVRADVSDEASVRALFSMIVQQRGRGADILVNNSGILSLSPQSALDAAEWDRVFAVNVRGLFLCCREAARAMRPGSAIVNIASINALHPGFGGSAHYDATKGAVAAYTRSLAAELGSAGIRVNAVAPGLVDSEGLRRNAPDLAETVIGRTPLGRLSTADDIGAAALFLASPAAGNITGEMLVVDGGYLLS